MKRQFLLIVAPCLLPFSLYASALSSLAASLKAGEWVNLSAVNITQTLGSLSGASGQMTGYTDDMVWDPNSKTAFEIGADHLAPQGPQFVSYTESNNTYQRLTRPFWLSSITFFHGYDHSAIDQKRGILYHRPYGQNKVHRYDIATQTWSQTPNGSSTNCCDALEYFPELGGLVWVSGYGTVEFLKDSSSQWSTIDPYGSGVVTPGSTWQQAEYNPVHKMLFFFVGGKFYKMNSAKEIAALPSPPISLYDGSGWNGTFTVDPVSGDYLVLTPTSRQLYSYNVTSGQWQAQASTNKPTMNAGVVATPVGTYGVTFFAACNPYGSSCSAYLYKHSAGTGVEGKRTTEKEAGQIAISPNPVTGGRAVIGIPSGKVAVGVYDTRGRRIARVGDDGVWNAAGTPSGVYLVRAESQGRSISQPIYVQH